MDDSLLLRSAESLGRVIGALQRQLDGATKRLLKSRGNGRVDPATSRAVKPSTATTRSAKATKRKSASPSRKASSQQAKKR